MCGVVTLVQGQVHLVPATIPEMHNANTMVVSGARFLTAEKGELTADSAWALFQNGEGQPESEMVDLSNLGWLLDPWHTSRLDRLEFWGIMVLHNPGDRERWIWINARQGIYQRFLVRRNGKWEPLPDLPESWTWGQAQAPAWKVHYSHLPVSASQSDTVLYSMISYRAVTNLNPAIASAETYSAAYMTRDRLGIVIGGVLGGTVLAILVFCLLLLYWTKDRALPWYVLFCAVLLALDLRNMERLLPTESASFSWLPWVQTKTLAQVLMSVAYYQFVNEFLNRKVPTLARATRLLLWFSALIMVAEICFLIFDFQSASLVLFYWYRLLVAVLGIVIYPAVWRSRLPLSTLILIGSFVLSWTEFVSLLALPDSRLSGLGAFGVLFDLALFSASIAYRQRMLIRERIRMLEDNQRLTAEKNAVVEQVRTQISQDIHDEMGGSLSWISKMADHISTQVPQDLAQPLKKISQTAENVNTSLKEVIFTLKPDYDQFVEVQAYFREFASWYLEALPAARVFHFPDPQEPGQIVGPYQRRQLFLIFKEALSNLIKYSQATRVELTLAQQPDTHDIVMEIRDNGAGFPVENMKEGDGLPGMRRRAEKIGAKLDIEAGEGKGCAIRLHLPGGKLR